MIIYKIDCEWSMPQANGYFSTKEKAQKAIDTEDWEMCETTAEEALEDGLVGIIEIKVN